MENLPIYSEDLVLKYADEDLSYKDVFLGFIELYLKDEAIAKIEVWSDYEQWTDEGIAREYIIINNTIVYIDTLKERKLDFEEWHDLNETEINIELAENGADREADFDPEKEFDIRYEKYLNEIL